MCPYINVEKVREDFPILRRKINGRRLVYLDNAATSQKPQQVIDAIRYFYENQNGNVHRSVYTLAEEATEAYESARRNISVFIGAASPDEIVFVRNATEALNLVSRSWGAGNLRADDTVALTIAEHHSNIIPWQLLCKETGAKLIYVDVNPDGTLNEESLRSAMDKRPKLIAVSHASNVLGTINDVRSICQRAREIGCVSVVDAAQSVPHMPVDVGDIRCDFLAFTGHKMLGPMGIGVLYARKDLLEDMRPFLGGGEMIKDVDLYDASWNEVPWKFEAGTPNVEGALGLSVAVDYLRALGMDNVMKHGRDLLSYALSRFEELRDIEVYGPEAVEDRIGIVSFNLVGAHPHDVALILDEHGIAVRSGLHCAHVLMKRLELTGTVRASFYVYNDRDDVDDLVSALKDAEGMLSS